MSGIPQESEVQALRQEVADTRKKLQDYADTIVSLHSELRTLRDVICNTCKRNLVLANLESSQDVKNQVVGSSSFANRHPHSQGSPEHANHEPRRLPDRSGFPVSRLNHYFMCNGSRSSPSKPSLSSRLPLQIVQVAVPEKSAPILCQHVSSSKAVRPKNKPIQVSRWSAKREPAADAELEVTFVRAFKIKYPVHSVRFSPDGKYLAAALEDDSIRHMNGETVIYNVETGEKPCVLAENRSQYSMKESPSIWCLSFSPDGRYLVVGDGKYHVTVVFRLLHPLCSQCSNCLCFQVWDIPNKRIRNVFRGHSRYVRCVNFSPNGRFVVSVSPDDNTMRLWNLRDGSAKVFPDASNIWSATFSPNGQYIAAGKINEMLMIWDVRTVCLVKS